MLTATSFLERTSKLFIGLGTLILRGAYRGALSAIMLPRSHDFGQKRAQKPGRLKPAIAHQCTIRLRENEGHGEQTEASHNGPEPEDPSPVDFSSQCATNDRSQAWSCRDSGTLRQSTPVHEDMTATYPSETALTKAPLSFAAEKSAMTP